ncbi:MAG: glycogen debranching protein GlgX [Actinomycetaceae bacterium]|nr:glycogen debranching protein GlgX [Actinomycetaceae bacterium]
MTNANTTTGDIDEQKNRHCDSTVAPTDTDTVLQQHSSPHTTEKSSNVDADVAHTQLSEVLVNTTSAWNGDTQTQFSQATPASPFAPSRAIWPTRLGVHLEGDGVDVAVASVHATAVEVCFFDSLSPDAKETRYQLFGPHDGLWHGHVPGIALGTPYGFRVWGPWHPDQGHRFNPHKLLLDPYARSISGTIELCSAIHAHATDEQLYPIQPIQPDLHNSAPYTVRGIVASSSFGIAPRPRVPWNDTIVYETHVRGLTEDLEEVPNHLRGTYAGLAHPVTVAYLKRLGVTTIELLPVHAKMDEAFLTDRGLSNYWGYSTLSYFAPEPSYATKAAQDSGPLAVLDEFRGMVSILHQAGLEVILDVVYNHTCEGSLAGQCLSWRGLDNRMYYRLNAEHPSIDVDFTGCGNTLDFSHPRVIQMTLDSLRYWVEEMGIDGFRYDLGVTLGRMHDGFTPDHPFFAALLQDPVLKDVKHIAEPWDIGPFGWRTGEFPIPFSQWNDKFRDAVRRFWLVDAALQAKGLGEGSGPNELATRLSGSQDILDTGSVPGKKRPYASVNLVTAHDGFTLADLVCYDHKHNEANLEDNRDGSNNNLSWNHGMEGRTGFDTERRPHPYQPENRPYLADLAPARQRSIRNLMATMLISAGTPMIVAGDEFGRTQYGNNNAYCQDNEISWVDWDLDEWQWELFETTQHLIALRKKYPAIRPPKFLSGDCLNKDIIPELGWFNRFGAPINVHAWHDPFNRVLQMSRSGFAFHSADLLVVFNGTLSPADVKLAPGRGLPYGLAWDSSWDSPSDSGVPSPGVQQPCPDSHLAGSVQVIEPMSMRIYLTEGLQ